MSDRFDFEMAAQGGVGRIEITGVIGSTDLDNSENTTPKRFADSLKALGEVTELHVHLTSVGGSVSDGLALHSQLVSYPVPVNIHLEAVVMSMGSYIATAGDRVTMPENGLWMMHYPWGKLTGNATEFRKRAETMEKTGEIMAKGYAKKSGLPIKQIQGMLAEETWLTADEALDLGFVDEITSAVKLAAQFEMPESVRIPAHITGQFYALFGKDEVKPEAPKGAKPMATAKTDPATVDDPQGPVAASLKELKAMQGLNILGDGASAFVLEQLDEESTIAEAQSALNAKMAEIIQAKDTELVEARKESKKEVVTHGVTALSTETPNQDTGSESLENPTQAYADMIAAARAKCQSEGRPWDSVKASQKIRKEHPEIFEAMGVKARGQFWN